MPLKKGSTLSSILKCSRCRKDKAKCLPVSRQWPGDSCDRCVKYNYECSEGTPSQAVLARDAKAKADEGENEKHGVEAPSSTDGVSDEVPGLEVTNPPDKPPTQETSCIPWIVGALRVGSPRQPSGRDAEATPLLQHHAERSQKLGTPLEQNAARGLSSSLGLRRTRRTRSPPTPPIPARKSPRHTIARSRSTVPWGVAVMTRSRRAAMSPLLEPSSPIPNDPVTQQLMAHVDDVWTNGMDWLTGVNQMTRQTINDAFKWQLRQMASADEMVRHALLAFASAALRQEYIESAPNGNSPEARIMWQSFLHHLDGSHTALIPHRQNLDPRNALPVAVTLFLLAFASLGEATIEHSDNFINMFNSVIRHTSAFPLRIKLGDPRHPCSGCGLMFRKKIIVYDAAHPEDVGGSFHT